MREQRDLKRYDGEFVKKLLHQMLLIRRFEERAAQMYGLRKIGGFFHACIGQEAAAVGAIAAANLTQDYVLTAYRDHGHALMVGMDPRVVMAELFGKITGCSRGKGGSMHLFDVKNHFFGGNGIVGAHLPIATGVALKIKYLKESGAVLCFFGDGAIHQGTFHESLNLAKIWSLPVVYLCENNQYGMGTDFRRVSSVEDFSSMAQSYGMTGKQVDGMDVLEVYEQTQQAIQEAKQGNPSLLEVKTYRYLGHSMSDPGTYRTKDEVAQYRQQDPIIILKQPMLEQGIITEDEFAAMEKQISDQVTDAVQFAESSEEPAMETMYEDLYV